MNLGPISNDFIIIYNNTYERMLKIEFSSAVRESVESLQDTLRDLESKTLRPDLREPLIDLLKTVVVLGMFENRRTIDQHFRSEAEYELENVVEMLGGSRVEYFEIILGVALDQVGWLLGTDWCSHTNSVQR